MDAGSSDRRTVSGDVDRGNGRQTSLRDATVYRTVVLTRRGDHRCRKHLPPLRRSRCYQRIVPLSSPSISSMSRDVILSGLNEWEKRTDDVTRRLQCHHGVDRNAINNRSRRIEGHRECGRTNSGQLCVVSKRPDGVFNPVVMFALLSLMVVILGILRPQQYTDNYRATGIRVDTRKPVTRTIVSFRSVISMPSL